MHSRNPLPRSWTPDEIAELRSLLAHPCWKRVEKYLQDRIERHKEQLVNEETEKKRDVLSGRIKEVRALFEHFEEALKRDAEARANTEEKT